MTIPVTQPIDIGEAIRFGWRKLWENFLPLLIAGLVVFVVSALFEWLVRTAEPDTFARVVLSIVNYVVSAVIAMGWIRIALRITRGETPEVADIFRTARYLVPYVLASILFGLMVTVGLVLLVIPGIWAALTFGFYGWVVVDRELDAIESLRRSYEITRGHKWQLLAFFIVLFFLNLAGLLILIVGVLFTAAISLLAVAHVYRQLSAEPVVDATGPV